MNTCDCEKKYIYFAYALLLCPVKVPAIQHWAVILINHVHTYCVQCINVVSYQSGKHFRE